MPAKIIISSIPRHPQEYTSPGAIRYRIRFLRSTFGDILNNWPGYAQTEYQELSRRLRELESSYES